MVTPNSLGRALRRRSHSKHVEFPVAPESTPPHLPRRPQPNQRSVAPKWKKGPYAKPPPQPSAPPAPPARPQVLQKDRVEESGRVCHLGGKKGRGRPCAQPRALRTRGQQAISTVVQKATAPLARPGFEAIPFPPILFCRPHFPALPAPFLLYYRIPSGISARRQRFEIFITHRRIGLFPLTNRRKNVLPPTLPHKSK